MKETLNKLREFGREVGLLWKLRNYLDEGQDVVIRTFESDNKIYHVGGYEFIDLSKVNETINGLDYPQGRRVDVIVTNNQDYIGMVSLKKRT